ncbi:MAG TPA: DUF4259 domain-containing protein [Rhodothermales bacterium]|nr:DUF4259 domain-containing protein [Rhodothermales bacterium]
MGTWAATSFGNDAASDFAYEVMDAADAAECLAGALREADTTDYLDSHEGARAVAAAEIVAALHGRTGAYLPGDLPQWVEGARAAGPPPAADLTTLALRALDRIAADESELKELWDEVGAEEWEGELDALRGRLA